MIGNARLLNEARELEARWSKSGLLSGIIDRCTRATTAVLLESQRLMNEMPAPANYWMRYIEASKVPLDPDNFIPRKGLLTRYGQKRFKEIDRLSSCELLMKLEEDCQ